MGKHFFWSIFSFFPLLLFAQSGIKVEHLTQEEGLSHRWVHKIVQDQKGFIWIATQNGLNRYDGYEFEVFNPGVQVLKGVAIEAVQADHNGMLWLSRGLDKPAIIFNPNTLSFRNAEKGKDIFYPNLNLQKTIAYHFLNFISGLEDIPVITGRELDTAASIAQLPLYQPLLTGFQTLGTFSLITQNRPGEIWIWNNWSERGHRKKEIIRRKHYIHFEQKTKKWKVFKIPETLDVELANTNLPIDTEGRFWFPSFENEDQRKFDFFHLPNDIPLENWYAVRVDNRLNIWIFNRDHQLFRFDKINRELEYFGKMESFRVAVFEDEQGTIWIGTENGIRKIRRRKRLFETYLDKEVILGEALPFGHSMSFIVETSGGHIFSNKGFSFLAHIPPDNQRINIIDSLSVFLTSLNENHFYFQTSDAISIVRGSPFEVQKLSFPKKESVSVADLPHKIPLLKDNFFQLVDTLTHRSIIPEQFSELKMRYLFGDKKNHAIWANYQKGIIRIDLKSLKTEYTALWEVRNLYFVRGWLPEGDQLWLATIEGLMLFDLKSKRILKKFSDEDGLSHKTIYSIVKSGDNLWLGTHNGLCCFNPKTLEVRNFYVDDGLTHNEFNTYSAYVAKDRRIWMGSLNGLNVFHPDELLKVKPDTAQLFLTKFTKYNLKEDSIYLTKAIQEIENQRLKILPSDQSFTVQFMLNSLTNPSKNQYYWYLEGLESAWSNVDEDPIAAYQNVPPGIYTLKVKATDSRGNPASNELAIPIQVLQVWYKRWWAWIIYTTIVIGAAYLFYRFQVNRKLEQQEAIRLKELDAVKTKLYTNITHEFRTPLTVILGMTEQLNLESPTLANDYNSQKKLEEKLDVVSRNGQNLLSLVNQMLDLSKLESGKMSLNLETGNIVSFLKYLFESFHSYAESKRIQLHFHSEFDALTMGFDREKMQNIIVNLLSNAIKFTNPGGAVYFSLKKIKQTEGLDSAKLETEQDALQISVKDNGIGISPKNIAHIFDRFYQADDSPTRQGEGTGIGLALVKELVKLMGGKIEVDSEINKGTIFYLSLPIQLNVKSEIGKIEMLSSPTITFNPQQIRAKTDNHQPGNERPQLLIIEDNIDVQNFIKSLLEKDYQISTASDGAAGIENALVQIPDIIISDVMMPKKDGFQVLETLKNDERTSHIPIILLTAKADIQSRLKGLERGADAYLAKPFERKELMIRIQKLVELRQKLQNRYASDSFVQPLSKTQNPDLQIEDAFLTKLKEIIENHLSDATFGTAELCQEIGMSKSQLYRKLKALTNRSIALFIRSIRLNHGKQLLETSNLTISEIAYEVGFTDPFYFSRTFSEEFGQAPSHFRK